MIPIARIVYFKKIIPRKKAPQNATQGSKIDRYRDYNSKTEKLTVIYDNFGRQKYRIDHSDHSMPKDIQFHIYMNINMGMGIILRKGWNLDIIFGG